jgi:hypothetical protein
MSKNHQYDTLSKAIDGLRERGYTHDFHYEDACLHCHKISEKFEASDLKITEVYRFEGISDPDDNDVLYAIESKNGYKGILIDAYGVYADEHKSAFLNNIEIVENY